MKRESEAFLKRFINIILKNRKFGNKGLTQQKQYSRVEFNTHSIIDRNSLIKKYDQIKLVIRFKFL